MSEGPKLYTNKPKKSQLKQNQQATSSSTSMSSSTPPGTMAAPPPPPPPQPPKESFSRRYKFLWPLLLAVNFTVGAYFFTRTKKKDTGEQGEVPSVPSTTVSSPATAVPEKPSTPAAPIIEPPKPREPIPVDQQKELFKWMLEEKRKMKPKDAEERKRIDEEKAILKQFIRAKSIPSL